MIQDYVNLISDLNTKSKLVIGDGFKLTQNKRDGHRFVAYHNIGSDKAINRLEDGNASEVYVYNWFGSYYLYVEIKFILGSKVPSRKRKPIIVVSQCSISISVFKLLDTKIVQLFRAEWDDFEDSHSPHPQPHWHIISDTSVSNTFDEYARYFGDDGFTSILKSEKEQISSLNKFHFAMKGKWDEGMKHSMCMESSKQVSSWFVGLLQSIKTELEYIDKR